MNRYLFYILTIWLLFVGYWEGRSIVEAVPGHAVGDRASFIDFARMDNPLNVVGFCPRETRRMGDCHEFTNQADGAVALCLAKPEILSELDVHCRRWVLRVLAYAPRRCVDQLPESCSGRVGALRRVNCIDRAPTEGQSCRDWQAAIRRVVGYL